MARKEKFGKLVLLEETEASLLGSDYRAAKLGPSGLDKIVTLLRLRPALSANAEVARSLMDQVKLAAQLQNPNILRIFGIGKVDSTYYVTYEFVEGKSLQQVLERCRQEGYPFAVDHALLIASKVAGALEYAHGRKNEAGARTFHGLLAPATVVVSYEGEVRLKSFGYWPSRVREGELLLEAERRYLAPEQAGGGLGDTRSDIFGLGAILFETLTGQPPTAGTSAAELVGSARLASPAGDDDAVPKPLADILQRALATDPSARYADIAEMRKAIDTLLFSGDFTPTTFNLAFFMHSLFREDMEREAKALKEEREASYAPFLTEEPPRPAPAPRASDPSEGRIEPSDSRPVGPPQPEPVPELSPEEPQPVPAEAVTSEPLVAQPHPPHLSSPGISPKEAAGSFTFHKEEPKKGKAAVFVGLFLVLLLAAGGGYFFLQARAPAASPAPTAAAPTTLSPDAVAAQQRVKELEEKLHALEAEKQAAEAKAADDAKSTLEAQAKAKGQEVDQAAVVRAEEEARQKTRKEQERKQQEETKRLEDQKRAEEARIAEERRRAEETAAAAQRAAAERAAAEQAAQAAAPATPPPTTAAAPPPTTEPGPEALRPGTLVNLSDPGVIAPILEKKPQLAYPPIALRQRVEGTVSLNVLVDERGNVTDAQVLSTGGGKSGLSEAAADYARRWKYRAATKDGVPVKVWTEVKVVFKLPAQ